MRRFRYAELVAAVAVAVSIAAPFCFRQGVPGLRHDWIWPFGVSQLGNWFIEGLSSWNSAGLGSPNAAPTVNFIAGFCAALGYVLRSTNAALFVFLIACFVAAQMGMTALLGAIDIRGRAVRWFAGAAYAYSPIVFQKMVAGHLYYAAAYALLPYFAYCAWRACERGNRVFYTIIAGFILAVSSTQVQFLLLDAIVFAAIAIARRERLQNLAACAAAVSFGLLHNVVALANLPSGEGGGILARQSTVQWEIDLSGRFTDLFLLGGYMHYDLAGLPGALTPLYDAAKFVFAAAVAGGLVAAFSVKKHRAAAAAFTAIGVAGLLAANGWYGPLRAPLQFWMYHSPNFAIFQELYHFMALYVLAACVLLCYAAARIPKTFGVALAAIASLVSLPFLSAGLPRMIPAVRQADFAPRLCSAPSNLIGLLPNQEPVGLAGRPAFSGLDPARWIANDAAAGAGPLVNGMLWDAAGSRTGLSELAALGFGCVAWRPNVQSYLPSTFEPHTGARFGEFLAEQERLRRVFAAPVSLTQNVRPLLSLEPPDYRNALDGFLADARLPQGIALTLRPSLRANDIRTGWVSGPLWAWFLPQYDRVSAAPIVTLSRAAELSLRIPRSARDKTLYVLLAGTHANVEGRAGRRVDAAGNSPYRWESWPLNGSGLVALRIDGPASVARAIVSRDAHWKPASRAGASNGVPVEIALQRESPWRLRGSLPAFDRPLRLVFARTFAPGWVLSIGGTDVGRPSRAHGVFNGWLIDPKYSREPFSLQFAPQSATLTLNLLALALQIAALAVAAALRVRAKRSVTACVSP